MCIAVFKYMSQHSACALRHRAQRQPRPPEKQHLSLSEKQHPPLSEKQHPPLSEKQHPPREEKQHPALSLKQHPGVSRISSHLASLLVADIGLSGSYPQGPCGSRGRGPSLRGAGSKGVWEGLGGVVGVAW